MLPGITAVIKSLASAIIETHPDKAQFIDQYIMDTTATEYPHIILIDYKDHSTGYLECENLRSAHHEFTELKKESDVAHLRIRFNDGAELCWENPDTTGETDD